jgi:2-dehydro-3-deoxygluconokinase
MDGAAEVVTLGESMVLFVPEQPGPLRHAARFSRALAGAESNVAIGLCRLGHPAAWIGRVGEDEFGAYVLSTLRGEGVGLAFARADGRAPTGLMFKEPAAAADSRVFYYRRGSAASLLDAPDVPTEALAGARWLHITGITPALGPGPRRAVGAAVRGATAAGLRLSFDPNYRSRLWPPAEATPVLRELASAADVLLCSEEEADLLFGTADPAALAAAAGHRPGRLVAVKRGDRGAGFCLAGEVWEQPAWPLRKVVEPTGAGDAFAAGLIAGLLEGRAPAEAGRMAAACGALACTVSGDWEGAPERPALEAMLRGQDTPRR